MTMRAIVYNNPGPPNVLQLTEVDRPVPGDGEVLIRVHATTVTSGDCRLRSFRFPFLFWLLLGMQYGVKRPKTPIPGSELSGDIETVGKGVTDFRAGDPVFASTGMRFGANAEYVCMPEDGVVSAKPANLSYEEAAAVPFGGLAALYFLRKGDIQRRQKLLVYGASGSVGSYGVQLGKVFGASVAAVCSTRNVEWVASLGADRVIDYTQEDVTESGETYDLIFDAVGKIAQSDCREILAPDGAYVTVTKGLAKDSPADLLFLKEHIEVGRIRPVIDRRYPLEEIVEAHRYVEQGHKKGNVVITVR